MYSIYKITSPSNKIYIDYTILKIEDQWKKHLYNTQHFYKNSNYKMHNMLYTEIKKYGKKHFTIELLEECNEEFLQEKLKLYNSQILGIGTEIITEMDKQLYLISYPNGYGIINHPMGPNKKFTCSSKTMEEKLKKALKYLTKLKNIKEPILKLNLPKYIYMHRNGYYVKYQNHKKKYFVSRTIPKEELYNNALKYLESMSDVQRLNGSGESLQIP